VYGPVRTVVWQGTAGNRCPYADQTALSECGFLARRNHVVPASQEDRDQPQKTGRLRTGQEHPIWRRWPRFYRVANAKIEVEQRPSFSVLLIRTQARLNKIKSRRKKMPLPSKRARWGTPMLLPACRQNESVARSREEEFPDSHLRNPRVWHTLGVHKIGQICKFHLRFL